MLRNDNTAPRIVAVRVPGEHTSRMRTRATRIAAVVVPVLLLPAVASGCTADPVPASETTSAPVAADPRVDALAHVTDATVAAAVADIDASVKAAMDATGTPGVAVAVVHGGETVFARGYGVRNLDTGEPVDEDTVFAMASVSKSVGATVIARAIDEGVVTWDTPVQENLPSFALSDPWVSANLTIGDLYAHRSGLFEHAGDELEEIGYDRAAVLERLRLVPLEGFRRTYAYGNFDITAAAESVAAAAGEDWADLSERLLYAPLGMTSTSSRFADLEARENRALGHQRVDGVWVVSPEQRRPDAQSPAGGVSSSVTDMARWMTMVLAAGAGDDAFVSREALLPAVTPQIMTGRDPSVSTMSQRAGFYGYGFNVTTTAGGLVDVNHSGAFRLGTGTTVKMLPAADLGIVVLSDGEANGVAEGIAGRFADIAQYGAQRQDWLGLYTGIFADMAAPLGTLAGKDRPADATPPAALDRYAGVYRNDYFGDATVSVVDGALQLALGPTGRWTLSPWDGDVFTFAPTGENATEGTVSQATFGSDGSLVLEYFDQHRMGTFRR